MLDLVLKASPQDSKEPQTARILLYKLFYDQTDQGMTQDSKRLYCINCDEVKAGQPLKVNLEVGSVIHISQAALGEGKKGKGNDIVPLQVNINGKKLLTPDKPLSLGSTISTTTAKIGHAYGGWIADTLVSKGLSVTTVHNAINWIFGACLLPYTPEPCQDTCFSSAMHGMQSGIRCILSLASTPITKTLGPDMLSDGGQEGKKGWRCQLDADDSGRRRKKGQQ
ncbi:hypothetical protein TEA_004667 [Camellia sinensis var. sinensis]|uniref:Uncharacterized protein n=1 Tax=Camellia sinensis var. sinensis TaxID=542762 RepID=A0A4S4DNL2_CAMSN|nr:hypothetical protein TEA_004667 [Camellia sinensis var. sinensis]